jgi:hypothetical protein
MIVALQGTKGFNDYSIFLRGMGVALRNMDRDNDTEFVVYSAGPGQINSFAMEFLNVNERSLKAYGIKTKFVRVPPKWLEQHIHTINYVLYFSKPKESLAPIVDLADAKGIDVGVYRY